MSDETFERKVTTPAEREARKAFRQVEAEKAIRDMKLFRLPANTLDPTVYGPTGVEASPRSI
jgi:hypothetical protein